MHAQGSACIHRRTAVRLPPLVEKLKRHGVGLPPPLAPFAPSASLMGDLADPHLTVLQAALLSRAGGDV